LTVTLIVKNLKNAPNKRNGKTGHPQTKRKRKARRKINQIIGGHYQPLMLDILDTIRVTQASIAYDGNQTWDANTPPKNFEKSSP
jgi:hypothetical protein